MGRAYRPDPGNAGDGHPLTGYAVGRRGRRRSVLRVDVSTPPDRLILDEAAPYLTGPSRAVVIDDVDGALTLGAAAAGSRTSAFTRIW